MPSDTLNPPSTGGWGPGHIQVGSRTPREIGSSSWVRVTEPGCPCGRSHGTWPGWWWGQQRPAYFSSFLWCWAEPGVQPGADTPHNTHTHTGTRSTQQAASLRDPHRIPGPQSRAESCSVMWGGLEGAPSSQCLAAPALAAVVGDVLGCARWLSALSIHLHGHLCPSDAINPLNGSV